MTDPSAAAPAQPMQDHRFPCTSCGADMRYDPAAGQLTCDHCGHSEPADQRAAPPAIVEQDFRAAIEARLPEAETEETRTSTCPNCGARVEFSQDTHALECPFCATPVVIDTGTHRQIKPRAVLPFALSERQAREAMNGWLGRLWFAPNGLKDYARKGRKMQGIYVPYWTYDADTKSSYRGERGDDYYVTKTVQRDGKSMQVRERRTRWSNASGRVARFFDDVLVLASRALPARFTDALQPWDLSALTPYSVEFLAGFRAEAYTIELSEGYEAARAQMDAIIARDVRFAIGGDRQRVHAINTNVSAVTFKHILLPVWMAAYKYRGKSYRFVVNGQTGKVRGERPWSAWKIAFAVVFGLLAAAVIGFALSQAQ